MTLWRSFAVLEGLAASRPAASAANHGLGYYATDTDVLSRSDGTTWHTVGTGGSPGGAAGGALDGTYPNPGLAASVAGAGLAETSDVLSVNVDGSTLEISSDTLRIKNLGVTAAKMSSGAATNGQVATADGAGAVTFADPAGSGASATDSYAWMPLTSTVSGDDVLVFDADHSLIPTFLPI